MDKGEEGAPAPCGGNMSVKIQEIHDTLHELHMTTNV